MLHCKKQRRKLYESCVSEYGEADHVTIKIGLYYAEALLVTERRIEAKIFLTKLYPLSKRELGPEHIETKRAEELLHKSA